MARLPPVADKRGCLMAYKLLLIENARNTLVNELRNFTEKANIDVQNFLKSPSPATPQDYDVIVTSLDLKCNTIEKLTTALINSSTDTQLFLKACDVHKDLANPLALCKDKRMMVSDVLKFGPMLQSVLMAASIGNAVQVLGATLSLQQLKLFFTDQNKIVNSGIFHCSISSSPNTAIEASTLSTHSVTNGKTASEVVYREKRKRGAYDEPKQDQKEFIPKPLSSSSKQLEISHLKQLKLSVAQPLIGQGLENDVHVQHQKQTSSQLMHFLRTNAKIKRIAEVTWIERRDHFLFTSSLNKPTIPILENNDCKIKCGVSGAQRSMEIPFLQNKLLSEMEIQAPVFKVKGIESSGSLVYTCMIATKTELWDVGDIFTEMPQATSETSILEKDISHSSLQYQKSVLPPINLNPNVQSLQATEENKKLEVRTGPQSHPICTTSRFNHIIIPEFQIRKFEEMEVVVTHIVNPGCFYIQHSDSILQQQAMVTDWKGSGFFADQKCIPDIGTYVMGWFAKQESWCRAQVTKICGISGDKNTPESHRSVSNFEVEVRRLDYGDTACLSLWNIKELSQELTVLPLQAIKVSLAHVTPVDGSSWSEEAVGWFRDIVQNRTLYARLYPQGAKVMVELFLEKGKMGAMRRGASLSLRLAQNGHATHDKLKNRGIKTSSAQVQVKKQEAAWEKYVLSCYTQNKR